jgi:hypothetical protein
LSTDVYLLREPDGSGPTPNADRAVDCRLCNLRVVRAGRPGRIGQRGLRQRLEREGVQAVRFQCSPYYVNSAFWPVIDNLERALKFARDETTDAKLDKLEELVVTQYGRKLTDVRFVASILSIRCEQPEERQWTSQTGSRARF